MIKVHIKQHLFMGGGCVGIHHRIEDNVEVTIGSKDKHGNLLYPGRYRYPVDSLLSEEVQSFDKGVPVRVIRIVDMDKIPDCPRCDSQRTTKWLNEPLRWLCQECKLTFNPDDPKEQFYQDSDKIKKQFKGKEANMAFDLSNYKPEKVKDNDFEVMTGKNNICVVNSAKIEDVEGGTSDRTGEDYEPYKRLRYELEVVSEKFKKRKIWKSYNLDSVERTGKAKKTPTEKLADVFFTIGLEFSNLAELEKAVEKFAEMTLVVSFSKFTPKGEKEPRQLHTLISVAPEKWDSEEPVVDTDDNRPQF